MKKLLLVPIVALLMSFSQCDKDSFDKKPPVDFSKMYYQDWVGGRPGSKGTLVTLITKKTDTKIAFDSIYFAKKVAKLETSLTDSQLMISANFVEVNPKDRDLILSNNPQEEFGNKPPKVQPKIPFKLAENEAIVSYTIKDKKRYFRLQNIPKEKTLYYP